MNPKVSLASLARVLLFNMPPLNAQPSPPERIAIFYAAPADNEHQPLHDRLKGFGRWSESARFSSRSAGRAR